MRFDRMVYCEGGDRMNIIVHMIIAKSIRKTIYEQLGEKLNFAGFLYGNILPDLSPKFDSIPHNFKSSLSYISANAIRLGTEQIERGTFVYSKRAGIITHYLSDYFCFAHSSRYTKNIYSHHLYEFLMLFLLPRGLTSFHQSFAVAREDVLLGDIEQYIRTNVEQYERIENLKIVDLYYAMNAAVNVNASMIENARRGGAA
jgi:hypothetical protein